MKNIVEKIIVEEFSFLMEQYDFSRVKINSDKYAAKAKFINKYCAITIKYEYREAYLFIVISRLIEGKEVPNPDCCSIHKGVALNNHSLDDLLPPEDEMQPTYEYGMDSPYHDKKNGLRNYIAKFADNLKKYGKPFFNGDFSLFPALDEIVVARVEEWKKQQGFIS